MIGSLNHPSSPPGDNGRWKNQPYSGGYPELDFRPYHNRRESGADELTPRNSVGPLSSKRIMGQLDR